MKKRNISVIRNCGIYINKIYVIEEWLEPGSKKYIGIRNMQEVEIPEVFGYYKNAYGLLFKDELLAEIVEDIFSACFWSVPADRICKRLNEMSCATPDRHNQTHCLIHEKPLDFKRFLTFRALFEPYFFVFLFCLKVKVYPRG